MESTTSSLPQADDNVQHQRASDGQPASSECSTTSDNISHFENVESSDHPTNMPSKMDDNTDETKVANADGDNTGEQQSLDEKTSNSVMDASETPIETTSVHARPKKSDVNNRKSAAQVFNATSSSLNNLLAYGSGDSEVDGDDDNDNDNSDDSDSYECDNEAQPTTKANSQEQTEQTPNTIQKKKKKKLESLQDTLKQLGELSIDELPPVPTVTAAVQATECDLIGKVASIIDKLVMVETIPNKPAYDIDTLLFLERGRQPLGYIFDVIGPVTNPMYAIRFNTIQDITSQNVKVGMPVYSAPKSEHSHYVFVQQLLKQRGSDASWTNDYEVPSEFQDYSDDEAEGYLGVNAHTRKRSSLDRHKDFEKDMNVRNLIDSRLHKVRDHCEPKVKKPNQQPKQRTVGGVGVGVGGGGGGGGVGAYTHHQHRQMRPNFHQNTSPCAFHPSFMPSLPSLHPYVPQFMPSMPPPLPAMQFAAPPPPPQHMQPPHDVVNMFAMAPPSASQAKAPTVQGPMLYPPDMGLPPTTQNPNLVPNLQYYTPQVMWNNFAGQPPTQPRPSAVTSNDIRPRKKFYKMRRK